MAFWKSPSRDKAAPGTFTAFNPGPSTQLPPGYRLEIDRSGQRLSLDLGESDESESALEPRLTGLGDIAMISAAVFAQKAKLFDDGLYAAVELATMDDTTDRVGEVVGKRVWLQTLRTALGSSKAAVDLWAAGQLLDDSVIAPPELTALVDERVTEFRANPDVSTAISFYTWNEALEAVFAHDRMLQWGSPGEQIEAVARAIHANPQLRQQYESYLGLIERLTNPLSEDALRQALRALDAGSYRCDPDLGNFRVLPPSMAPETELAKKLFGDEPIPDGVELMTVVIKQVRAGNIDLRPLPGSGWYVHQLWSFEAFLRPETTLEASHLCLDDNYAAHLENLFKGVAALARETHAKQLEVPLVAAAGARRSRKQSLAVCAQLSIEPVVTHYRRRADAYRFVRSTLEEHFGEGGVQNLYRQRNDGPVAVNLADELAQMIASFEHAANTAASELGLSLDAAGDAGQPAGDFSAWDLAADVDLAKDIRMMVPVFFDGDRQQSKVWLILGWSKRPLEVDFGLPPKVRVLNREGKDVTRKFDILYEGASYDLVSPVFAEVYVKRILNREEFRALCDREVTREAILAALVDT